MTPQITQSVRAKLECEAAMAATAKCNERLEHIDHAFHTLLNDWEALKNSPEMGAIQALGRNGHVPAKEVVRWSSDLLTRAQALGRALTRARGGMADQEVHEETGDTPAAKRARTNHGAGAMARATPIATPTATASASSGGIEAGDIRNFFRTSSGNQ